MDTLIKTIKIRNVDVKIYQDEAGSNGSQHPIRCGSHKTIKLATTNRLYDIGSSQFNQSPEIFKPNLEKGFYCHLESYGLSEDDVIFQPVYIKEDFDKITLSVSPFKVEAELVFFISPYDSTHVGYIYWSKDDIREHYGVKRISSKLENTIYTVLESKVAELDDHVNNRYCSYEFEIDGEVTSNAGYLGLDNEAMIEDIFNDVNSIIDHKLYAHFAHLKKLIKSKVGLQHRPTQEFITNLH